MTLDHARQLRQNQTDTEQFVWTRLRDRRFAEYKFRRQVPIGNYVVDFVCLEQRLIIELDGGQHTLQREYDAQRTLWLSSQNFRVVRFWNHDVLGDWQTIEEEIWRRLRGKPLTPDPSPARGEG